jgi:OmpA-OmpF porin, OOP family
MVCRSIAPIFVALSLLGSLSACTSGQNLARLQEAPRVGLRHNVALMNEYEQLAVYEAEQRVDFTDADYFAGKGLAASAGQEVLPEEVGNRALPPDMVDEFSQERAELVAVIFSGGREFQPERSAHCQAMYDCWIVQQEEDGGVPRLDECRDGFRQCMTQLAARPAPVTGAGREFVVLFGPASANLDQSAQSVVGEVLALVGTDVRVAITVVGHTDSIGPADANQRLSLRRAEAVRDALVAGGIDPDRIRTVGAGESEATSAGGDGVADPASRRAVVETM